MEVRAVTRHTITAYRPPRTIASLQKCTRSSARKYNHLTAQGRPNSTLVGHRNGRQCAQSLVYRSSLLRRAQQARHESTRIADIWENPKLLYKEHPVKFPFAISIIVFGAVGLVWALYQNFKIRLDMKYFPEDVGVQVRRALYFTDHEPDLGRAMKAWLRAINLAIEHGMHPASDEVIAIYLNMARTVEEFGGVEEAIAIHEAHRERMNKFLREQGQLEENAFDRRRVLQRLVEMHIKLGSLYGSPAIRNYEKTEQCLTWALETSLKELERREREGVKPSEGDWFSHDEIGQQLEGLGHHYEDGNQFYYASQLFLKALHFKRPPQDCHSAILMNNIATSIAQTRLVSEPGKPIPTREPYLAAGRTWLNSALQLCASIKPPLRTEECDLGCIAATHNLGEFLEMENKLAEAKDKYEEAARMAQQVGFGEGTKNAESGLKRLANPRGRAEEKTYDTSKMWWWEKTLDQYLRRDKEKVKPRYGWW